MAFWSRLANVFRSRTLEREIDEEFQFHVDERIRELMAEGMSREIQPGYPDLEPVLAAIRAERIMLAFGSGSPHRGSATQGRIMQAMPNVRSAEIPGAGHPPRLLTPYEWTLLGDFLLEP